MFYICRYGVFTWDGRDVMSFLVDCILQASYHKNVCFATCLPGFHIGENGVNGPWGKWSEIKVFAQIQAHYRLLLKFFAIEI